MKLELKAHLDCEPLDEFHATLIQNKSVPKTTKKGVAWMNFEQCCWALELGIPATKYNYSNKKTNEVIICVSKDR